MHHRDTENAKEVQRADKTPITMKKACEFRRKPIHLRFLKSLYDFIFFACLISSSTRLRASFDSSLLRPRSWRVRPRLWPEAKPARMLSRVMFGNLVPRFCASLVAAT